MSGRPARSRVRLNDRAVWDRLNLLHLSQNELARRVGLTSGYLSQLINGRKHPSPRTRLRLQQVLGVTEFDDLFVMEHNDDQ